MKKILLIITVILTSVSGMQASDITVYASDRITNLGGKYYTIHYKFGNGNLYPVIFDGTTLKCSSSTSDTPATLYFSPADNNGLYKIRVYNRDDRYWKFTRNKLLGNKTDAVNIQIFQGGSNGTYRICGLTTNQSNSKNSRCYLGNGNGDELNYTSSEWTNDAESGKINVNVPQSPGSVNWNSDVVLTEVYPDYVEANALTTGWYQVRVGNSGNVTQNYITTKNENIAEGGYPAKAETLGENIGATMLYFEVGNSATNNVGYWINVRDSKGRYMTRAATSSIVAPTDKICCIYNSGSSTNNLVFTIGTNEISNRTSWKDLGDHIGIASEFPAFFANKASDTYSGNAYAVKVLVEADGSETISYNGTETHYGFNTVYNNGTFFFAQGVTPSANDFTFDKGTNTNYSDNPGIFVDSENKTITVLPYANRDVDVPSGYNGYIGGNTDISETEWKTKEYWTLQDSWNNNGPGISSSGMWNPIYLKDITSGTVPALEGWNFRMIADNSKYTIESVGKIQGGMDCYFTLKNTSVVRMNFGTGHTFNFTINLNEGTGNILNFVMSNGYQCTTNSCTECPSRSTITVNYGDVTKDTNRQFNASGSGNIKKLVLNATLTDPAEYNKEESIVLATLNSVSVTDVEKNISDAEWTEVNNYDLLKTQNTTGKFYYIEESISNGVRQYTLHTYKQIVYTVESDKNFSEIYNDKDFANFKFIYIPSGKKLTIDTNIDVLASRQIIKAESNESVIQIDEGYTLYTSNIISGQNPKIIGAGTFKTTTYTTSVPLNVTLGSEWTGIVARANANVYGPFNFSNLVNGNLSKVQMTQVQGWLDENSSTNANIVLYNGAGSTQYGFCVNVASDGKEYTFSGNFSGEGDFVYNDENNCSPTYNFSGNLSEWTGKFNLKENGTGTTTVNVTSTGNINAGFKNSSTKANTLELIFSSNSDQNINGEVTTSSKNNTLNMTLNGTGTKTIGTNITANNLTIINSNGAEITISGSNRIINVTNLNAYTDNNNTLSSLNINMSTNDIAAKLDDNESCTLISVTGSMNASSLQINGQDHVTVGDYDYYISYNDNAITLSRRYYSRNVTSGNFGSICIQNGALVSQMTGIAKVLKVTKVTTDRVVMDEVEEMTPGVPYIFKSNASAINLTLKGATEANPVDDPENYLVGNFSPVTVPTSDQNTSYYVLQSNQFKKVTSASSITSGSNRCYLKVPVTSDSRLSILGIAVDDGGATGIDAINSLMNNDAEIYDLNGRRLNDLRKGINIVNGVKVIVK